MTGLEFATAMAATRKQKLGAPGSGEPVPRSASLLSGAGAEPTNLGRVPPPEAPPCDPPAERSLRLSTKLGVAVVASARSGFGQDF